MKGYREDHQHFCFRVKLRDNISHNKKSYVIKKVSLRSLYARVVVGATTKLVKHKIIRLQKSPHYAYLNGNKKRYRLYLKRYGKNVGYGIEHSVENFEKLIADKYRYLEGKYRSSYIVCQRLNTRSGRKNIIIDGFHRACILLHEGVRNIPVAFLLDNKPDRFMQFDQYLRDYKDDFQEWYTPIEISGRIIHERTYPTFKERQSFLLNKERGKSKWDFIIKNNLPDLKGKTICDVGCNNGLYSIFMVQMGAKIVNGFDRGENVIQPTNKNLPRQNVIQQAYFVRNLFKLAGGKNLHRIHYYECDIAEMDFSKFKYDVFFSSCVLYHFGRRRFEEIIKDISNNISEIFLQTNLGHKGKLANVANLSYQRKILQNYGYSVKIDSPNNYNYPILYGIKYIST